MQRLEPKPHADLCLCLPPQVIYTVTDIPAFQVGGRCGNGHARHCIFSGMLPCAAVGAPSSTAQCTVMTSRHLHIPPQVFNVTHASRPVCLQLSTLPFAQGGMRRAFYAK